MSGPACVRCGQPITPGARYCTKCGADVSGEQGNLATARMSAVQATDENGGIELLRRVTIGEYEILAELGRGGMATVYLAHEISLDRKVAIKLMAPHVMFGQGMAERFRREARTAAALSHPHIIPIFAVKESGGVLFFVMKFVAGRPLDDLIREVGPLPIPMVKAILSQVGNALGYAHRRGVIHRDIKPANVMIDDEGWAIVTDFGIAKVAETHGLTMTGVAVGTPSYMSPEQCAAKEVTGKSDQYSLGVVAYEMITGRQPFTADTAMAIMWQHFNDPPTPIRELRPDCPEPLEAAVMRMLEKKPDQRWPTVEDAVGALKASPLAHDDPVRLQMVALAQSSPNQKLLDQIKTPTSLVPPTRESGQKPTEVIPSVASVAVTPRSANLAAGESLQLSALFQDASGSTLSGRQVTWTSSDPSRATVSPDGVVTALAPGEVIVTLTCEGKQASAVLKLEPAPIVAVTVTPAAGSLEAGETLQLAALLKDAQGRTDLDRPVKWISLTPAVATVSASGLVTAVAPGTVRIEAGCEDRSGRAELEVTPARVAVLSVDPAAVSLVAGEKTTLKAVPKDARGQALRDRSVSWVSADPKVATVTDKGAVAGTDRGTTQITAECEGIRVQVPVEVGAVPVARVVLRDAPRTLETGQTSQLSAAAQDGKGRPLEGREIRWRSSDEALARIAQDGYLTAVAPGEVTITAESEGKSGSATIKLTAPAVGSVVLSRPSLELDEGDSATLQLEVRDTRGAMLTDRTVAWASSRASVATVSGNGTVQAVAEGSTIVSATVEGKKATTEVRVRAVAVAPPPPPTPAEPPTVRMPPAPAPPAEAPPRRPEPVVAASAPTRSRAPLLLGILLVLALGVAGGWYWLKGRGGPATGQGGDLPAGVVASMSVSPATPSVAAGDSLRLQASFLDAAGVTVQGGPVVWSSDNPAVATVTDSGVVHAASGGSATIIATSGAHRDIATLTVRGAATPERVTVASVAVSGVPASVTAGETVELTAEIKGADGAVLGDRPVVWTSSDPAVARVTQVGVLTALAPGTATITATSEGRSGTASLTIKPVAIASVSLTPSRGSIKVGGTLRLSADVRDARGNAVAGRAVEWSSSDERVATVSPAGVVTGVSTGSATITGVTEGRRGTTALTVVADRAEVARVLITPATGSLNPGETLQLTAQLQDGRGAAITDRTPAWSSSNPAIATVSPTGLVTAAGEGTATITAASDERSASARITVQPAPVAAISVSSPPASLPEGESFQLNALVRDGRGNVLSGRDLRWSSDNPRVASVSQTGRISAESPGSAKITVVSEGKSVSVTVTVPRPVPTVASVGLSPASGNLNEGQTLQLSAVPRDARGGTMDRPVSWSSSNESVARVSSTGLVTAVSAGSATITATSDGRSSTAAIAVAAPAGPTPEKPPVTTAGMIPRLSLSAGGVFTCAGVSGAGLACWGAGTATPRQLAGLNLTQISAGEDHACG
ncbi:MAG: Ig-like domain-containing protein, partial [Gemmatimonadales bacterium]